MWNVCINRTITIKYKDYQQRSVLFGVKSSSATWSTHDLSGSILGLICVWLLVCFIYIKPLIIVGMWVITEGLMSVFIASEIKLVLIVFANFKILIIIRFRKIMSVKFNTSGNGVVVVLECETVRG